MYPRAFHTLTWKLETYDRCLILTDKYNPYSIYEAVAAVMFWKFSKWPFEWMVKYNVVLLREITYSSA